MSLRITAGKFKGRVLSLPSQQTTRPTSAKIRLAMFNILLHNSEWGLQTLKDKIVFDGFAGSGSLGLECLSRGAEHVYFCETHHKVLEHLHHNIHMLASESASTILRMDVIKVAKAQRSVDLLFLDPPYRKNYLEQSLVHLQDSGWIGKSTIVVIEYARDESFQWPQNMEGLLNRNYGQTILHIGRVSG